MFDESTAFHHQLTKCEHSIQALRKATDGMLAVSEKTLSKPLPSVWDNTPDGTDVQPVAGSGAPLIAPGLLKPKNDADLQTKVYDPITSWQKEYARMRTRVMELDKASLRLDAARRAHYKGAQKHLKENVMQQDNVSARGLAENENPELTAARTSFQKTEAEVYSELQTLAQNARHVQGYLCNAMALTGETLQSAAHTHSQSAGTISSASAQSFGQTGQLHPTGAAGQRVPA